jgi:hypothetical protein
MIQTSSMRWIIKIKTPYHNNPTIHLRLAFCDYEYFSLELRIIRHINPGT